MMRPFFLELLCCVMVIIFPAASFAAEQPAAMLYSHGTALLNGNNIARSSAIFTGDLIQTNPDSAANINAVGSSVLVLSDSLVEYEEGGLKLEHGGVTVSTSKLLRARAGDVTVSPTGSIWTEFEVRDVDGTVRIAARKGDLTISDGTGTTTLAQGQETTRDDTQSQTNSKKSRKRREGGDVPGAQGGILNSPIAVGVGGALVIGGTVWALSHSDNPVSPAKP